MSELPTRYTYNKHYITSNGELLTRMKTAFQLVVSLTISIYTFRRIVHDITWQAVSFTII